MLRVFIGYDPRETLAFHVLAHSIMRHASQPVLVAGIKLGQVPMWRERDPKQSTEFSFSRFLVPYLCDYQGHALFLDCDMLCLADVYELMQYASSSNAVSVTRHDYTPHEDKKFLGAVQTKYRRKNWSSCMLFNNAACQQLTPQYVNWATGLDLHQFGWCQDQMIGSIPLEWNYLVGEDNQASSQKVLHWTKGGPWFSEYKDAPFAEIWFDELKLMGAYARTASS